MILHHVTPYFHLESIFQRGISPVYSKGAEQCCWYVTEEKLMWAINHVCEKFDVERCDVAVIPVPVRETECRKRREGVYTIDHMIPWSRFKMIYAGDGPAPQ